MHGLGNPRIKPSRDSRVLKTHENAVPHLNGWGISYVAQFGRWLLVLSDVDLWDLDAGEHEDECDEEGDDA
jgi:hypothetical protein